MTEAIERRPTSQVSVKTVVTVCLTALLVAALAFFVVETRLAITVTVTAALIAAALHHGVDFLQKHRVGRGWALTITLAAFLLALGGVVMLVVPTAVSQGSTLVSQAPTYLSKLRHTQLYEELEGRFHIDEEVKSHSSGTLSASAEPALRALSGLVRFLAGFASTIFLVVFMLVFGDGLVNAALNEALPSRRPRYERMTRDMYRSVGGYIAGLGFICTVNATLTSIFLAVIQVPFFLTLGIASGFSSLIPYLGPVVAGGTITLIVLATKGVWAAFATFVYFVCYGQLEGQVLGPLIFRRTVHVSPLVTFLAILFFADLAGAIGAIVAVPAAAAGQIILRELLAVRRERLLSS